MKNVEKKRRRSKGFTLVEMLIVIIIIGALSGMMMLSTGSATDKAEATRIVSDMRNIKAAAIMYYSDHSAWPESHNFDGNAYASLDKYLDKRPTAGYGIDNTDGTVNVTCGTGNSKMSSKGVKDSLKAMADESALYLGNSGDAKYNGGDIVYMRVK
ncbi:MAG: type II secretion system protein [Synergistes sp.]|nr:type II secretion system protein [Synergistes sp.]